MKLQFWRRYKTRFPPELYPSDATLSRVTRELNKRMLCVFSVWKVKSLQFQLVSTSKKRKLGENLFTEDQELEEVVPRDWESYLDRLRILLTAYALAGVQAVAGGPPANSENTVGADTTQFVQALLDVVMEYFYRAKCSASQIQPQKRLAWLQHRDTEERAVWVSKFRESTKTLGSVVREVMNLRDAHWIPVQASASGQASSASPAKPAVPAVGAPAPPAKVSSFQLGRSVNGKKVARVMKDGKRLCQKAVAPEGTSAPTSIGAASCSRARCLYLQAEGQGLRVPRGAWGLLRNRLLPALRLWRICLRGLTRRYQRLSSFVGGGACQWISS